MATKLRGLMAAAILSGELASDEKINTALLGAAFEEIDGLRQQLADIPKDIEAASAKFRGVNVQAVDDFVSVANEALSKFMLRTGEMKEILGSIEKSNQQLLRHRGAGQAPAARSSSAEGRGLAVVGGAFFAGMVSATVICLAVMFFLGK